MAVHPNSRGKAIAIKRPHQTLPSIPVGAGVPRPYAAELAIAIMRGILSRIGKMTNSLQLRRKLLKDAI